ncbi:hypothetical protein LJR290_007995 [Variovorax sp. LjRoot290]|uniref:hypothetical protein n=1 Tax=Variovorax sp. LjRoot290 TaxID=3342316 RepID=UPI003ECFB3B4
MRSNSSIADPRNGSKAFPKARNLILVLCLALGNLSIAQAAPDYCGQATSASQAALDRAIQRQNRANTNLSSAINQAANCQNTVTGAIARVIPQMAQSSGSGGILDQMANSAMSQLTSAACSALNQATNQATGQINSGVNQGLYGLNSGVNSGLGGGTIGNIGQNVVGAATGSLANGVNTSVNQGAQATSGSVWDSISCSISGKC